MRAPRGIAGRDGTAPAGIRPPRPRHAAAWLVCLCAAACESSGPPSTRAENERVNLELLEQLLESSALDPVTESEFSDGDLYAKLEAEYADVLREEGLLRPPAGAAEPVAPAPATPFNPYLEFGSSIKVYDDDADGRADRLMKPYPFPVGMGSQVLELIVTYGGLASVIRLTDGEGDALPRDGGQPAGSVVLDLHAGGMLENWTDPRHGGLSGGKAVHLGDMLYVTGAPEELRRVERLIDVFARRVRQVEIEAKIVEVTTSDELDIGIRPIPPRGRAPIFGLPDDTFVRDIDFDFGNTVSTGEALFRFSSVHDGLVFNAVLEAVATFENVSIISRPKVAVREGGRAEILNTTQVPFYNITNIRDTGAYSAVLEYKDVGVQLYVIPRVVGTDTIMLNLQIEASQQSGTSVSFVTRGSSTISNPILTRRSAKTTVYLDPGQAVILGGLITERIVDRETKIPILGDFPILGALFRSTYKRKEQTNVLFFIRPRILSGIDLNRPFE